MSIVLIGSRALALRLGSAMHRRCVDFDFVATREEADAWVAANYDRVGGRRVYEEGRKLIVEGDTMVEFDVVFPNSSDELLIELVKNDKDTLETSFGLVPSIDTLFCLKSSHRFMKNSPHFWKTFQDFHAMKRIGAKIRPEHQEFLSLREKETYNFKLPSLNRTKKEFFNGDGVEYVVIHDDIHESVKFFGRPAYTYYLKDQSEVQCDKEKFFNCSREIQLAGICEEALVLSIERSQIPHPGVLTPKQSFMLAFSKVLSSITGGWFRSFGYDNGLDVLKMYPENYWEKFKKDLKDRKVRYIKEYGEQKK